MCLRFWRAGRRGGCRRCWRAWGPVRVTGGTGALGGHVARWLAGRGAPRVILTSRAGIGAAGAARLAAEVAEAGTAVRVGGWVVGAGGGRGGLCPGRGAGGSPFRGVVNAAGGGQGTAL